MKKKILLILDNVTKYTENTGNYMIAFYSAAAIAFLSLNENSLKILQQFNALEKLKVFCENVSPSVASTFHISEDEICAYYALFDTPHEEVLGFLFYVFARYTKNDDSITMFSEAVIKRLREDILDQLKHFSNHSNGCIRRLAREGLTNLGEKYYTLEKFLKDAEVSDCADVVKILSKAEVDLPSLLDEKLDLSLISANLGRNSKLHDGTILKILSFISRRKQSLGNINEQTKLLAKKKNST